MSTGKRIAEARESAGMSKASLARAIKVSGPTVTDWENDVMAPKAANHDKLATVLGVSPQWLLSGKGLMRPTQELTPEEQQLLEDYRSADAAGKESLTLTARAFASSSEIKTRVV